MITFLRFIVLGSLFFFASSALAGSRICVGNFTRSEIQWELISASNEIQAVSDHHSWENGHGYLCADTDGGLYQLNIGEKSPVGKFECSVSQLGSDQWVHVQHDAQGKLECAVFSDRKKVKSARAKRMKRRGHKSVGVESPVENVSALPSLGIVSYAPVEFKALAPFEKVSIYVSPSGDDSHPGTMDQPVKTVARGQQIMPSGDAAKYLFLDRGNYPAPIVLTDGITIVGGYSKATGWNQYHSSDRPVFSSNQLLNDSSILTGVYGQNLSFAGLSGIVIQVDNTQGVSQSVYGIYCDHCGNFSLTQSVVTLQGDALDGTPGINASPGGGNGGSGLNGGDSIGVMLMSATQVQVSQCSISSTHAGNGGMGGKGGDALGSTPAGNGGSGGNGGSTFAIYSDKQPALDGNTLKVGNAGSGGVGGSGGSPNGENGYPGFNGQVGLAP